MGTLLKPPAWHAIELGDCAIIIWRWGPVIDLICTGGGGRGVDVNFFIYLMIYLFIRFKKK